MQLQLTRGDARELSGNSARAAARTSTKLAVNRSDMLSMLRCVVVALSARQLLSPRRGSLDVWLDCGFNEANFVTPHS